MQKIAFFFVLLVSILRSHALYHDFAEGTQGTTVGELDNTSFDNWVFDASADSASGFEYWDGFGVTLADDATSGAIHFATPLIEFVAIGKFDAPTPLDSFWSLEAFFRGESRGTVVIRQPNQTHGIAYEGYVGGPIDSVVITANVPFAIDYISGIESLEVQPLPESGATGILALLGMSCLGILNRQRRNYRSAFTE